MTIEIKKMCSALKADYLDFFDHRAFSDNNPNGPCYCTSPNMDKMTEAQMVSEFGQDVKGTIRRYAVDLLDQEIIQGYLAYDGDLAIGWCNANNMEAYKAFVPDYARQHAIGKTLSVVCFEVDPHYRGRGIATALLEHVCRVGEAEGYTAVEGYVTHKAATTPYDYTGPYALYKKVGFHEVATTEKHTIMRREFKAQEAENV